MRPPRLFKGRVVFMASFLWLTNCVFGGSVANSLENRLALEIMKLRPKTNLVVSPLAVRLPMCKLATVADGAAKEELMNVLGYKKASMINNCYKELREQLDDLRTFSLLYINKIYVNYSDDINPSFLKNSSSSDGVLVDRVGFQYPAAARSFINKWVETVTLMRIRDMLNADDIDKNTTMIMISALHFKPVWMSQFDFKLRTTKRFHGSDSSKVLYVPMMSKVDSFDFIEHEPCGCKIIILEILSGMVVFVVPNSPRGLPNLIDKIHKQPDLIKKAVRLTNSKPIRLFIPLFKIKTYVDWTGFLQEIGLKEIFSETSTGLNSILTANSRSRHLRVNKVKQKVFVDFDEMGPIRTTPDPMRQSTQPVESVPMQREVVIDSPFYFTVTLTGNSGSSRDVFSGVYYGPE